MQSIRSKILDIKSISFCNQRDSKYLPIYSSLMDNCEYTNNLNTDYNIFNNNNIIDHCNIFFFFCDDFELSPHIWAS